MGLLVGKIKRPGRSTDSSLAKKSKTSKAAPVTVKGSKGVIDRVAVIQAMVEKNLGKYRDEYIVIRERELLHDYITECIGNSYISIDTETDGLDPYQNIMAGICVYSYGQKGAYIPLNHISYVTGVKVANQLPMDFIIQEFDRLLEKKPGIDMFNANFDIRFMRAGGVKDIYCSWDGYLASRLLNENEPQKGLKALHNKYCLDGKGDAFKFDDLFKGIPFTHIPINTGYLYAAHDPVITTELCDYQRKFLGRTPDEAREDLHDVSWVFHNIEMPCVSVVCDMEDTGVGFDKEYAEKLSVEYHKKEEGALKNFYNVLNMYKAEIETYKTKHPDHKLDDPINISSPTQLAILLYDILKVKPVDKNSHRGTGVDILNKIDNPICKAVLDYRAIGKLLSTYIDKLPECVNPKDGRIHCSFNQIGADTGRFSSSDPNLQNIPSRNHDIRKMFVASPGHVLMSSDYSQQEPKVMTQMCGDPKMIKAYQEGKDLYAEIAALSFNTSYDNCLEFRPDGTTNPEGKNRRSQAKSILLGVLYGRGVQSIAEQLGTTTKKAQAIKDSVFKGFPAIPQFEKDSLQMAYENGFVTTLWGRKRRLPAMQLPEYEFKWKDGAPPDDDLLDFDSVFANVKYLQQKEEWEAELQSIPQDLQDEWLRKLRNCGWRDKLKIKQRALEDGIVIVDNGGKIADAERQCVNSRIQGSAADMSKLAMIAVGKDKRLKELGFKLLIPVHDELIGECPKETAEECKKRFAQLMSEAAQSKLNIPISCDVELTERWYGPPFSDDELKAWWNEETERIVSNGI